MEIEKNTQTTESIQVGNTTGILPEFGRAADVQRLFGLKRGTLYNMLNDGKVRSVLQRVRGQKSGVRLFYLAGIREMLMSEMKRQGK